MRISDWSSDVCSSDLRKLRRTSRMTKEVQLAGGNATNQNQYIGPPRELTVDTSNQELRLHDGVTPGGHRFPNRDSNDQRYQAKSSELDGFNGWEPSDRGWLVRLGPATYRQIGRAHV